MEMIYKKTYCQIVIDLGITGGAFDLAPKLGNIQSDCCVSVRKQFGEYIYSLNLLLNSCLRFFRVHKDAMWLTGRWLPAARTVRPPGHCLCARCTKTVT